MQATGIVRRIDDLGRVVIPREIRKAIGIREGDPLEIFIDRDKKIVSLQRYASPKMSSILNEFDDCLSYYEGPLVNEAKAAQQKLRDIVRKIEEEEKGR